jgi:hypothetical protein
MEIMLEKDRARLIILIIFFITRTRWEVIVPGDRVLTQRTMTPIGIIENLYLI